MNRFSSWQPIFLLCLFGVATEIVSAAQITFNPLTPFDGIDGADPYGSLIQGFDGNFYGTTYSPGTVFTITPAGEQHARQRATVIVTGMLLLSEPEVPISSIVVVPLGARREALQVMVTVAVPLAVGVTGLAVAVADTLLGNSLTLNSTAELNPFTLVTVSVVDTFPRSSMVNEEGDNDRVKFLAPEEAFTVRTMVVV